MAGGRNRGRLDAKTLKQMVADDRIETVLTAFPDLYGRLVGKRVTGDFFVGDVLGGGVNVCDYLLACDMEMDPVPGYAFTSWARGYGDVRLVPDLATLRVASWLDRTALVLCDVFEEGCDDLVAVAPRTILRRQVERAARKGFVVKIGSELEHYTFRDSYEDAAKKGYEGLEPIGRYVEDYHLLQGTKEEFLIGEIRRHLDRSGVPVETSKGEWGPGQHEINLRFSDALETADRHAIFKHAAKEIAWQRGVSVTFMAKWTEKLAGSSMHTHASVWSRAGDKPLFPGRERLGPIACSPTFRRFLGGWMAHVRELFAFYAPYPTSYKRYVAGSFAPTGIAWSHDNRTAGFRIVGSGPGLRIECRAPGADANPYLAIAATIAAGLDGIEKKIDPPAPFDGDAYAARDLPQVPRSLPEAVAELEKSKLARRAFGDAVVEHYLHFFRTEQRKFDEVVTSWERARYFERA